MVKNSLLTKFRSCVENLLPCISLSLFLFKSYIFRVIIYGSVKDSICSSQVEFVYDI